MNAAAKKQWPGNCLPIFKGKETAGKELEELVNKLLPDCSYCPPSLPMVEFGKNAIRQHILDSLNERRRRVHSGHDYESVRFTDICARTYLNISLLRRGFSSRNVFSLQPPTKKVKVEPPATENGMILSLNIAFCWALPISVVFLSMPCMGSVSSIHFECSMFSSFYSPLRTGQPPQPPSQVNCSI